VLYSFYLDGNLFETDTYLSSYLAYLIVSSSQMFKSLSHSYPFLPVLQSGKAISLARIGSGAHSCKGLHQLPLTENKQHCSSRAEAVPKRYSVQ